MVTHFEVSAGAVVATKPPAKRDEHIQCGQLPSKRDEHIQFGPSPPPAKRDEYIQFGPPPSAKRDEHIQCVPPPAKRDEHIQCGPPPKPRAKPNRPVVLPIDRFEQLRSGSESSDRDEDEAPPKVTRSPQTQVQDTSKSTFVGEQERLAQAVLEQKAAVGEMMREHAYIQTDSMKVAIERYRRTELIDETISIAIDTEDLKPVTEEESSVRRVEQSLSLSQKPQETSDSKETQSDPQSTRHQAILTDPIEKEASDSKETQSDQKSNQNQETLTDPIEKEASDSKETQSDPQPTQHQETLTEPPLHEIPEEEALDVLNGSSDVGSLAATRWRSLANDFLRDETAMKTLRSVYVQSGASAFQQDSALRDSTLQTLPPVLLVNNSGTQTDGQLQQPATEPARDWTKLVRVEEDENEKPDTVARGTQTSPIPVAAQELLVQKAVETQTETTRPVSRASVEEQQSRRSPQALLMSNARLANLTPPPPKQMKELGIQVDLQVPGPRRAPVTRSKPEKDVEALLREMGVEFGKRRGMGVQVTPMLDEASMATDPHLRSESTQTKSHELGYRLVHLSEFASLSGASSPPTLQSVTSPLNLVVPIGAGRRDAQPMFFPSGLSPKEPNSLTNTTTRVPEQSDESPPLPEEMVAATNGSNARQFSFFPGHMPHSRQRSPARASEAFNLRVPRKKRLQVGAPIAKGEKQMVSGANSENSTRILNQKSNTNPLDLIDLNTAIF